MPCHAQLSSLITSNVAAKYIFMNRWTKARRKIFLNYNIQLQLRLCALFHPILSALLLSTLHCRSFGDMRVNSSDFSIGCRTPGFYWGCQSTALTFIVLYTIGIPGFMMWALSRPDAKWMARMKFLKIPYSANFWWFETIEMLRKLLLSGTIVFISPGTAVQPLAGYAMASCFLLLTVRLTPFAVSQMDLLGFISQICNALILLYAIGDRTVILDELGIPQTALDILMVIIMLFPLGLAIPIIIYMSRATYHMYLRAKMENALNPGDPANFRNLIGTVLEGALDAMA